MNKKGFNDGLTKKEIERQLNERLLDKYVWMNQETGAIVTEEKQEVRNEILNRMKKD